MTETQTANFNNHSKHFSASIAPVTSTLHAYIVIRLENTDAGNTDESIETKDFFSVAAPRGVAPGHGLKPFPIALFVSKILVGS